MEFNKKLQQLRSQKNLTQEQLAAELYVSRTAISKWESGKGYPNIESLKCISRFFSVSIDDLLSGEELLNLAQTENRSNSKMMYNYISGIIDILAIAFIVLPLYGKPGGSHIYSVNLLLNTHTPNLDLMIHWVVFLSFIMLGIARITFIYFDKERFYNITTACSVTLGAFAVCLFAAAREPYATILLFLFFAAKIYLLIKQIKIK